MAKSEGYKFGDYLLLEHIGSGSFGVVYKARLLTGDPDKSVAIKILRPLRAELEEGSVVKFQEEAARLREIGEHPNIALVERIDSVSCSEISNELLSSWEWGVPAGPGNVSDFAIGLKCKISDPENLKDNHPVELCFQNNGQYALPISDVNYLVSRYYSDGNLENWVDHQDELPGWELDFALGIGIEIAAGLRQIHNATPPITHRDLNPQNILMDGKTPKIADFGISRPVNTGSAAAGTRGWADPEQLRDPTADLKHDQYAFGQLLFWLLTGEKPFTEPDYIKRPESVHEIFGDVKPEVSDVVEKCRDASKGERYHDCDQLIAALEWARAIQNGEHFPEESTLVKPPDSDDTLDLRSPDSTNTTSRSLSWTSWSIFQDRGHGFGIAFFLLAAVIILIDASTGSAGWRWIEWAHWPILIFGIVCGAWTLIVSGSKGR